MATGRELYFVTHDDQREHQYKEQRGLVTDHPRACWTVMGERLRYSSLGSSARAGSLGFRRRGSTKVLQAATFVANSYVSCLVAEARRVRELAGTFIQELWEAVCKTPDRAEPSLLRRSRACAELGPGPDRCKTSFLLLRERCWLKA